MTRPRQRRLPATNDEYAAGLVLVGRLAERLRQLQHDADLADAAAGAAIAANAAAARQLSDVVRVYRDLLAALADGGGYERPPALADATAAAVDVLTAEQREQ
jgi:hypothetical protein